MEKEENKETFDVNQGHGDHNDAVFGKGSEWIRAVLPECIAKGRLAWCAKEVPNRLGEDFPERATLYAIKQEQQDVGLLVLLGLSEAKKSNVVLSAYPECAGVPVEFVLDEVHEYSAGVEAVLSGRILGGKRDFSFFDTRYGLNKEKYKLGETYTFMFAALAYDADVLQKRTFSIGDDKANEMRKAMGEKPEFEKDGSVKPLEFDMSRMVASFQSSEAYPDDTEFQSPAYGLAARTAFEKDFHRLTIAIALDECTGETVKIPLYARKELFSAAPRRNDPIRGHFWLHGYLKDV